MPPTILNISVCSRLLGGYIPAASNIRGTFRLERVPVCLGLTLGVVTVRWGGGRECLRTNRSWLWENVTGGGEAGVLMAFEVGGTGSEASFMFLRFLGCDKKFRIRRVVTL